MLPINTTTGYRIIAKIYESSNSLVYRAILTQNNQPIILKILKEDYPTPKELTRYKQEYEITRSLNLDRVVKAYDFQTYQNSLVMFLEDFGGESLKILMAERKFTLEEFLTLAIEITESLGNIHEANIIHKDINPSNIVHNPETRQLKIIDFGISTILSWENPVIHNPDCLEGTLAYISPEQTGRMNRAIDYRSDFYSLGVTLYELLTHQLPFEATDPMELVHCHIAKKPVPPHLLKGEEHFPKAVSDIVMKLMAKTAEKRYQSAWGLKADLEACLHQVRIKGQISDFPLARQDISNKFQIPQKLYGRQEEVAQLLATFELVSQGKTEMMLVSGYSGIGKSALVNEVHKPIVRQRGYFISGKFDQFKRDIPYAALIQAFQELIRQLLTESEAKLQIWKQKLLDALGKNAQVIVDVIPEVELIIGEQPPVPQLGSTESQNRFNLVFQKFIGVFTNKEHPLVIFLDDLQWADSASLKSIELLMTDPDSQYLLTILAYRDNEVSATHPLMLTLEQIQKNGTRVNNITLQPLGINHINQLIADTLKCSTEKSQPLAELVLEKTYGNPFFLTQLLQSLYQQNLLSFNASSGCWQWDIEQIKAVGITDNVVDLMIDKIEKLDEKTQNILKLAACIGNRFDLDVLSVVNGKSLSATATELWLSLQEGLIVPLSDAYKIPMLWKQEASSIDKSETSSALVPKYQSSIPYKFLHDRVQQAAYVLIPEEHKKKIHLQIGNLLLKNTKLDELEEKIFDIVNQLNFGSKLITERSERDELARLNLIAGKKAKGSTAYETALRYLETGIRILASNSWQNQYELTLELYIETVEVLYLNTQFERAEKLSVIVLQRAKTLLDKTKVYESKIHSHKYQLQYQIAIDTALEVLSLLGVFLPKQPSKLRIFTEQLLTKWLLINKQVEDLAELPEMTDSYKLATVRILLAIVPPTFIVNPSLFALVIIILVNLCIKFGNSSQAAGVYSFYGLHLCATGDFSSGYRFGQLSLNLLDRFDARRMSCMVLHIYNSQIKLWKENVREAKNSILQGIQVGIENGDYEFAGYGAMTYCSYMLLFNFLTAEENLEKVEQESAKYAEFTTRHKQEHADFFIKICRQTALNLLGLSKNKYQLIGQAFNEEKFLPIFRDTNNYTLLSWFYIAKCMLLYILKDSHQCVENARRGEEFLVPATAGSFMGAPHNFYYSLGLLALYPDVEKTEKKLFLKKVFLNEKKMKQWAYHAPANYRHKYELVEAEKARVLDKNARAMEYYDRAIRGARENGYIQEEAIAYERAAEFYISIGREEIGKLYMKNAHYCYSRWGAKAKVKALEAEYPQLFVGTSKTKGIAKIYPTESTTGTKTEVLDLTSVIKASQTLASEIVLDKLLAKLMKTAIENAGAQKGFLILEKDGKWAIEAEGVVNSDEVHILQSIPIESVDPDKQTPILPVAIVNYVARTQENVVLNNATEEEQFIRDPYIIATQPKSILCTPLLHQGKLIGLLYLENNLTTGAFTRDRLEVLKILSSQAAISIQNAQLYVELRESERTIAQFLEALPVGVFIVNAKGQPYYANQTAQEVLGKEIATSGTLEQLKEVYQTYLEGTEQLYPEERSAIARALKGEKTTVNDLEVRRLDKTIPLEVSGTPIYDEQGKITYAITAFQDITERKQAESQRIQFTRELELKNIDLQQAKEALAESNLNLEQKVSERTHELSQTLEILKATQSELLFENELLRSAEQPSTFDYQVGGSLPMNAPTYVVRSADRYLYKALKRGDFCYILNPRQMGKSSLMVRMMHHLQHEGVSCGAIDLTRIGSENVTPEQWYKGLAVELWRSFGLLRKVNLKTWWKEREDISPVQRLSQFIEEVLLVEVNQEDDSSLGNIVIFIDEIDSVLGLNFPVNDFFALIRSCYNQRSINPEYRRLTFAFFGVATPSDLITDHQTTPFNIGQAIQLEGFKEHEAQPLLHGLTEKVSNPQTVLKEVLAWTGGQPFLTQKLCKLIRTASSPIPTNREAEWIENLVLTHVIENWESQDEPEHLRTIRDRLFKSKQSVRLLELYRQILHQGEIVAVDSSEERELLLSGLVVKQQGTLRVQNRIYKAIFV